MASITDTQQFPPFFSRQIRTARRFYLDLAPPPKTPLAVVCGGHEACTADYSIHRSSFPYYSVELVAKGAGTVILNGKEHALSPGAVFSYGPGVSQDMATDPDDLLEKYFVDFTSTRALRLLEQCALPPGAFAQTSAIGDVQEIMDNLIRDGLRGTAMCGSLCAALFEYLVLRLADSALPADARQSPAFATFHRCREHITANFRRLKSLEQIAEECQVGRAYLCRLFGRFGRQTPYRFLIRLKMNWAADRLRDPAALVKEIAPQVSFDDPFHFSHAFKNTFGLSPDAFRRLR